MEIDFDKLPEVLSTEEAAELLGMGPQNLLYHVNKGHIDPYLTHGYAFTPRMLKEFVERHKLDEDAGWTRREIAEMYGKSLSIVQYHQDKGRLAPIGKRGQQLIFPKDQVIAIFGEPPEDKT